VFCMSFTLAFFFFRFSLHSNKRRQPFVNFHSSPPHPADSHCDTMEE
jgi:hypothetical protein